MDLKLEGKRAIVTGGSLGIGWLGQRYRMKSLLALMYASRALLIALYLASPPTPIVFYGFAAGLGLTWLLFLIWAIYWVVTNGISILDMIF